MQKQNLRRALPLLLLVAGATLLASLPLMRSGLGQTHDGLFHYYRLLALKEAISTGCAYPRWFPSFAFDYGQPVLNFYGPLSYYAAFAGILIGLTPLAALKLSIGLGFLLSGLAMAALVRRYTSVWAGALAGAGYILFPYHLANVYVRGAYAEHWGLALLPLLLLAASREGRRGWPGRILTAVIWAFLICTHNLTALIAAPIWLLLIFLTWGGGWRRIWPKLTTLPIGLAMSALYWLPVLGETRYIGLGNTFSTDAWRRYLAPMWQTVSVLLPFRYFPDQGVLHQYPLPVIWLLLASGALILILRLKPTGSLKMPLAFFGSLAVFSWFLQWDISSWLWQTLPILGFLQFPWRLMGVLALGASGLIALGVQALPWKKARAWAALFLTIVMAAMAMPALPQASVSVTQGADWATQMWRHDVEIGQVGATWTAEYVPIWATVDRSAMPQAPVDGDNPPPYAWPDGVSVQLQATGVLSYRLQVDSPEPLRLTWHAFYFPGWQAKVDGISSPMGPYTKMGLASLTLPAGKHLVEAGLGETVLQSAGHWISIIVCGVLMYFVAAKRRLWLRIGAAILLAVTLWFCTSSQQVVLPVNTQWASFGNTMALSGWQLGKGEAHSGSEINVNLYWLALQTPTEEYKVFLHLRDAAGKVVAQSDGNPCVYTNTKRLVGGEMVSDRRYLALPKDLPAGRYGLYTGIYRWPEVQNLRLEDGSESLFLGWLDVR